MADTLASARLERGQGPCQWNSFMSRRLHRLGEVLASALDMAAVNANLLEGVDQAQEAQLFTMGVKKKSIFHGPNYSID